MVSYIVRTCSLYLAVVKIRDIWIIYYSLVPLGEGGGWEEGEDISQLYPACYSTKVYIGGIYYIPNKPRGFTFKWLSVI